jgi:hypothetical protein
VAVAFGVLLQGGVIAGWSSELVLAKASDAAVGATTIHPEGVIAATWARRELGAGRRFAADGSNARLLAAYADEFAITGTNPDVQRVIREPKLEGWHVRLLRRYRIRYVLVDRRRISEDALAGYFFVTNESPPTWRETFPPRSVRKFDRQPGASRLFDSGDIVVYDIARLKEKHAP